MVKDVLAAIGARNTSGIIASALKQRDLADVVSNSWSSTASRIEALAKSDPGKNLPAILADIYSDNVLYANKAVILWVVKTEMAVKLAKHMQDFVDPDSPYRPSYPFPLPESLLRTITELGVPTALEVTETRHTLIFASKRERIEEEPIPHDQIAAKFLDAGYTEFFAKKRHVFQVFDSISVLPALGVVELRIDQAKSLSEKDIIQYRTALVGKFNKFVKAATGEEQFLGTALNLEPALEPLYKGKQWVVHAINHQNKAGYANSNKGRNRSDDVRLDHYHSTGEAAVGGVQLWQVSAAFASKFTPYAPRLVLEGHSKMLNSLVPFMDIARVLDCATEAEYDHIFHVILQCLGIAKPGESAA